MSNYGTGLSSSLRRFEDEINSIVTINYIVRDGWNDSKANELLQIINRVKADADNLINAGNQTLYLINQYL